MITKTIKLFQQVFYVITLLNFEPKNLIKLKQYHINLCMRLLGYHAISIYASVYDSRIIIL